MNEYQSVEHYIFSFPDELKELLIKVRTVIAEQVPPETSEKLSYGMPTFYLNGNLVHYAINKNHLGFYPAPAAIEAFKEQLKDYRTSKGAIQFPFSKPIPFDLIAQIVRFRVSENLAAAKRR